MLKRRLTAAVAVGEEQRLLLLLLLWDRRGAALLLSLWVHSYWYYFYVGLGAAALGAPRRRCLCCWYRLMRAFGVCAADDYVSRVCFVIVVANEESKWGTRSFSIWMATSLSFVGVRYMYVRGLKNNVWGCVFSFFFNKIVRV